MCVNNAGREEVWMERWLDLENGGKITLFSWLMYCGDELLSKHDWEMLIYT